jgi:hypothetical protein
MLGPDPTPPKPRLATGRNEITDARIKQQLAKAQAAFAESLVDAFREQVARAAIADETSQLGSLTIVQLTELCEILEAIVRRPIAEEGGS